MVELDSVHCPGRRRAIHPSGGNKTPVDALGKGAEGQKPSRLEVRLDDAEIVKVKFGSLGLELLKYGST